ncbi:DUF6154 family protein [Microaerobacter geothermalis]|uniref:DUF6154 family protein n=1 Tax=Microaerobacter geothermalis TaxID=674972 RepID=UPI001F3D3F35|nr:DUF6154 family protein [Microaerobacter geothermalis]MCF6092390.1 DUF6154 family protein [Microaerobacter geothermalis]
MKFLDDLYQLYKNQLTGDEEDAVAIVVGILQEQDREHLLKIIHEMNEEEIFQMLSLYMLELMKIKLAKEGIGGSPNSKGYSNRVH